MAAARGPFIDHSQSLNVYIAEPNFGKVTSMHFFGWKKVSTIELHLTLMHDCVINFTMHAISPV